MEPATDDLPTVAAVYITTLNGLRTVGVAVLSARARTARGDVKSRSLRMFNYLDDDSQHTWLQRILHGCEPSTVYVADTGLPEKEMAALLTMCVERGEGGCGLRLSTGTAAAPVFW